MLKERDERGGYIVPLVPKKPLFTENETKDVLTALYQDGHVDLVLADRVAALMAASLDEETPAPAYTIEVEHEEDGRWFASWTTGDKLEGGCAPYSTTLVGALAELCGTLLKVAEDKSVEATVALVERTPGETS